MRSGRFERFVLLPFSIRCDSESSVAVAVPSSSTATAAATTTATLSPKQSKTRVKGDDENMKMSIKNQSISKAAFSQVLQRLIRRFKSFSQFFIYKEEMEEIEKELEIGFPTDVKHVTHIGLDGSTTTVNSAPNWENLKPTEILSFPALSLHQFQLAMAGNGAAHSN